MTGRRVCGMAGLRHVQGETGMARHRLDKERGATGGGRLKHFLRIERGPEPAWPRQAREKWLRQARGPSGRTVQAFAAIERGRQV